MVMAGYCSRKSATAGGTSKRPKDIGAASRIVPLGELASSCAASSAATASARIRAARSERRSPVSVSESRRDVRWNNVARSEEHTSEIQSLMRNSYDGFCLTTKKRKRNVNKDVQRVKQPT